MLDLLSKLSVALRAAHRSRTNYLSLLDVAAGRTAAAHGQFALAVEYLERALPSFVARADDPAAPDEALSDLMAANASLMETLHRLTAADPISRYKTSLAAAHSLQADVDGRLGRLVPAINGYRAAHRIYTDLMRSDDTPDSRRVLADSYKTLSSAYQSFGNEHVADMQVRRANDVCPDENRQALA